MISVPSSGDNSFVQAPPDIMREKFESISPNATCGSWQHPQTGDCSLVAMRKSVAGETWTHSLFLLNFLDLEVKIDGLSRQAQDKDKNT